MVAVQPTRGLDVGAIEGVHRLLLTQREAGAAVLLISEELEELLALSDRVYVIYEGKIMGEVKIKSLEPDQEPDRSDWSDDDGHTVGTNPQRRSDCMAKSASVQKRRTGFRIRLEPRLHEPPAWYPAAISLGAILLALILGGILIELAGGDAMAILCAYC